jgi:hypothetical protein
MAIEHANPVASDDLAKVSAEIGSEEGNALGSLPEQTNAIVGIEAIALTETEAAAPAQSGHAGGDADASSHRAGLDQLADRMAEFRADAGSDGSKSGLFGHADHAMDALLSKGAFAAPGAPAQAGHPAVAAALADSAGAQAVDAIVDHFAGVAEDAPELAGHDAIDTFDHLLKINVSAGGSDLAGTGFSMMQPIEHEQANAMA